MNLLSRRGCDSPAKRWKEEGDTRVRAKWVGSKSSISRERRGRDNWLFFSSSSSSYIHMPVLRNYEAENLFRLCFVTHLTGSICNLYSSISYVYDDRLIIYTLSLRAQNYRLSKFYQFAISNDSFSMRNRTRYWFVDWNFFSTVFSSNPVSSVVRCSLRIFKFQIQKLLMQNF